MVAASASFASKLLVFSSSSFAAIFILCLPLLVRRRFNYIRDRLVDDPCKQEDTPIKESSLAAEHLQEFTPMKYYEYLRDEIKREDELTNHRLTWYITFQGFVISALAILMITSSGGVISLYILQRVTIVAVASVGILTSFLAFKGILAARVSLDRARLEWKAKNDIWMLHPKYVPQPTGQGSAFAGGTFYAERIPVLFAWMWTIFLVSYATIFVFVEVNPCLSQTEFLECVGYASEKKPVK